MALLFFDGFEYAPLVRSAWTGSGGGLFSDTGRDGLGKGIWCSGGGQMVHGFTSSLNWATRLIFGWGHNFKGSIISGAIVFAQFQVASNSQVMLKMTSGGQVVLQNGNNVLLTTGSAILSLGWHYFEVDITVADAGGRCIVKIDGVVDIDFTGDTKTTTTLTTQLWDRLYFSCASGSSIDDFYICDTTGPAPYNAFLGEQVVKAKRVVGNGILNEWGGSDGNSIDNYLLIDEEPVNVTDYVSSNISGQKEYYQMAAVTGLASVNAMQQIIHASKSDSGSRLVRPLIRNSAGIVATGADKALSTSWATDYMPIRTTDPAGNPWTTTSINDIQVGLEVV